MFFLFFVEISAPQSEPVEKARVFEPFELNEAFGKIDVTNRYELVRGAVGVTAYFGANRMAEIKDLKMSGNESIWGYSTITYSRF